MKDLINKSIFIIRETKAKFKNPIVLWSTGKDSTAVLSLIKEAFYGEIPFPVVHIDTGYKFPEMYKFRDDLAKKWNLNLVVIKNEEALKNGMCHEKGREKCCTTLKTETLKQYIKKEKIDAVIVSIRRDEHGIRAYERYMSPRDKNFRWKIFEKEKKPTGDSGFKALQDAELSGWFIFATQFNNCDHVRVHPILHWTELDVWKYIKDRNLPVNPLYFSRNGKRFRSLGCMPCTFPVESNAKTIDEIVEELKITKIEERSGRAQDKESEYVMQKLRALGYM